MTCYFDYTGDLKFVDIASPSRPFMTESGVAFHSFPMAYETFGQFNSSRQKVTVVCHALSGHSHVTRSHEEDGPPGWWEALIGPGKTIDTNVRSVICFNVPGSCYGSMGPISLNPKTDKPLGSDFPEITVRDMVRAQVLALQKLGVNKIETLIGGSLGGMQVLEWVVMYPEFAEQAIVLAAPAAHQPWAVAFNHLARQAIVSDPAWNNGHYHRQPQSGLKLARQIAMVSYRSPKGFAVKFPHRGVNRAEDVPHKKLCLNNVHHDPESYLIYQGEKFLDRFDANSYLILSRAMDLHDLSRGRGKLTDVLSSVLTPLLWIGIDSDMLYPAEEQKKWCSVLPNGQYREIISPHGHDAFLIEFRQITLLLTEFFSKFKKVREFYENN